MNYAKALKKYRKDNHITQDKMAKLIGCSYSLYRLMENSYPVSATWAKKIDQMLKGE